jgi:trimethylamine:corrinoid methyltransferase-like protein
MISGAGMLDFLACQSPEKLVIDAEGIAMAQRLLDGFHEHTPTLALEHSPGSTSRDFLKQVHPEAVLQGAAPARGGDRSRFDHGWQQSGSGCFYPGEK